MVASWPNISGKQYETVRYIPSQAQRSVFQPDLGPPITRANGSGAPPTISFDIVLDGTELATFRSWWESDLELGSQVFVGLEDIFDDTQMAYQFAEVPEFDEVRGAAGPSKRLWRATLTLWKAGRSLYGVYAPGVYAPGVYEMSA